MSKIILGNWKMNQGLNDIDQFFQHFSSEISCEYGIAPQSIHLVSCIKNKKEGMLIGAQNCSEYTKGAYTGEISPKSLKELGVDFVLIGHSERRSIFGESNQELNNKTKQALEQGLKVVFCIGESLEQRQKEKTFEVLEQQLEEGLAGLEDFSSLILAYEPVWAIGTGLAATPIQACEVHQFIKGFCVQNFSFKPKVLYGGSVNPSNINELLENIEIDGALVGGASLEADSFSTLCKIASSY